MRTNIHAAPASFANDRPTEAKPLSGVSPAAAEIIEGLNTPGAWVSPKYLYDDLGARLFQAITKLPEYYPTRVEQGIFARHATEMARAIGPGSTFIDLGAGDCEKACNLFPAIKPSQYVAVDISADFLRNAVDALRLRFPDVEMLAVEMDFSSGLALPAAVNAKQRTFFYPGSSIGNFGPLAALNLLTDIRRHCQAGGGLLIGVDLVKDTQTLEQAYDDALGVTAAFNLNLLNHLNTLIGSNFSVRDWRHRALFNARQSRVEMHLEARREVEVTWQGGRRRFGQGERIHTENSYKYTLPEFHSLLEQAGFARVRTWTDERGWFAVCHGSVPGSEP